MAIADLYQWAAVLAAALMAGLLFSEKKGITAGKAITKLLLSSMFAAVAVAGPQPSQYYYRALLPGLLLCLAGDVLLAFPALPCFRLGLLAFLMGHVFYCAAFIPFFTPGPAAVIALPPAAGAALFVYRWLSGHLGDMRLPVIAYIAVISLMAYLALCASVNPAISSTGGILILGGALLFYISDLFVARDRFIEKAFINRLIGLPLYYAGQFMLAFSVSFAGG